MLNYNLKEVDYELLIGTKIGDLEWWNDRYVALFFITSNHGRALLLAIAELLVSNLHLSRVFWALAQLSCFLFLICYFFIWPYAQTKFFICQFTFQCRLNICLSDRIKASKYSSDRTINLYTRLFWSFRSKRSWTFCLQKYTFYIPGAAAPDLASYAYARYFVFIFVPVIS